MKLEVLDQMLDPVVVILKAEEVEQEERPPARMLPFHLGGYCNRPRPERPAIPCCATATDVAPTVSRESSHVILMEDEENPGKVKYVRMYADGHIGAVED